MAMYSLGHPKSRLVILKYPFHVLTHLRTQHVLIDPVPNHCLKNKQVKLFQLLKTYYLRQGIKSSAHLVFIYYCGHCYYLCLDHFDSFI